MVEHTLKNEYLQGPDKPIAPCIPQKDFSRNEYTLATLENAFCNLVLVRSIRHTPECTPAGDMQTHAKEWRYSMLLFCAVGVTQRKNRGFKTSVIAAVNSVEERERAKSGKSHAGKKSYDDSRVEFSA